MFTGIIETTGILVDSRLVPNGRRLRIDSGDLATNCPLGSSIAVNGVCLTAAQVTPPFIEFDVVHETLDKTTLGGKSPGDRVNLERSLRVGDRLDGHFVQGHVDGTATVLWIRSTAQEHVVGFLVSTNLADYLIPKGSIAIDGVSLTLAELDGDTFSVALIPTTLERTTLGSLQPDDSVNIETDMLIRALVHRIGPMLLAKTIADGPLRETGFA